MSETVKNIDSLSEAIIRTIAFFDLLDWPLTAGEIKKNLESRSDLSVVIATLASIADKIEQKDGFYFLSGREELIGIRSRKYNYFCRKLKIARRFARLFAFFPAVRAVALANCLGDYNLRDGSDIDFLVITVPGRIWLSRLYCTGLAKILNRRPSAADKRDKLCLSFYISENSADLPSLRLAGADPYFDYWLKNLILLYNKDKTFERFCSANRLDELSDGIQPILNRPADLWETAAKKFQLKIMPGALRSAINKSDGVVVSDQILKFYLRDRRREYAEKYARQIEKIF